jgi:dTDP-4-dehydrorhamnose reductase
VIANSHPRKSLVVGATGQVGSAIVTLLGPANCIGTCAHKPNLDTVRLDLAEVAANPGIAKFVLQAHEIQEIYCVGGMTNVDGCEADPELAHRVNCEGPTALAHAAAINGLPFAYFSTEYVFNGKDGPYMEESQPCPISAYGRSKLLGEIEIAKAHPQALIIRTTVVYGPDPGAKNFIYSLRRALLANRTYRVPDDQISTPTYNLDLARAATDLLQARTSGVIHVAGPESLSRYDFARRAAIALKLDPAGIVGVPTAELGQWAPRPLQAGLLIGKLKRLRPELRMHTLDESIRHWMAVGGFEALR